MRILCAFILALFALCSAQTQSNGLGSHPIDPVGITGANVFRGHAWEDLNRDGIRQMNEPPVPGIFTALYYDSSNLFPAVPSTLIGQEVTGPDGVVVYSCVNSGRYSIQIWGLPAGYEYTSAGVGYETINSDAVLVNSDTGLAQTKTLTIVGPTRVTYEFGIGIRKIVKVGQITGFVWADSNYDGVQDTTETGEQNVNVTLLHSGKKIAWGLTDMDGIFTFANITPGLYQLHFDISSLGSGFAFTAPYQGTTRTRDSDVNPDTGMTNEFNVNAGFNLMDIDAGVVPSPGTLEGFIWLDQNRNGIQDADEHGLPEIQIGLLDHQAVLVQTLTTDANGKFSVLTDSISYYVLAELDNGVLKPSPQYVGNDPTIWSELDSNGRTPLVTVYPGKTTSIRGGLIPLLSAIEFLVWQDSNDNGIFEAGLGDGMMVGTNVTLLNSSGLPVKWALTASSGIATFSNLADGSYSLSVPLPSGPYGFVAYRATNQSSSSVDSDISSVSGSVGTMQGTTDPVTLAAGALVKNLGAGIKRLYSSISGYVFQDFNRNGVKDGTDIPLSGIALQAYDSKGVLFATVTTTSTGDYTFKQLDPDTYVLMFTNDTYTNFKLTTPHQSPDGSMIDSEFPSSGMLTLVIGSDQQYCCADAGLQSLSVLPAAIEGFIWDDYSARTGIQTGTDTPISGVSVLLRDRNGNTVMTATSNSQGQFFFRNIAPSTYELVSVISAFNLSPYHAGTDRSKDSDFTSFGTTGLFNITEGQTITDLDLGLIPKDGVVSGKVWFDSNGDGVESFETALAGVTVTLYPVVNGVRASALKTLTTASTGLYSFSPVRPQAYQVFFDKPSSAWAFSPKHSTTDTRVDSDVNPDTGFTDAFTVGPQQTISNINAGMKIA